MNRFSDTNNDGLVTVEECIALGSKFLERIGTVRRSPFAPEDFETWNASQICNYMDYNNTGILNPNSFFFYARNFWDNSHSEWGYENRWLQQSCEHCEWWGSILGENSKSAITCSTPESQSDEKPTDVSNDDKSTNVSNYTCIDGWVDEKIYSENYYVCDIACEDLKDCSDCGSNSMCYILQTFFTVGDADRNLKISVNECESIMALFASVVTSYWNGYDADWLSMTNREKCLDMDINNDFHTHPDETIRIFQHFMNFTYVATRAWEFENRFKQVSCEHCEWYLTYEF